MQKNVAPTISSHKLYTCNSTYIQRIHAHTHMHTFVIYLGFTMPPYTIFLHPHARTLILWSHIFMSTKSPIHACTYTHMHFSVTWIYPSHYYTISLCPQGPYLSSGAVAGVVLGGLVFLIVLAGIAVCVGVLVYGYRNPTSKIGLFMIEV